MYNHKWLFNFIIKSHAESSRQKQKYRGMFETQKSGDKTSSGEIGLNIRTLVSPKVGQDQLSGGVSVLCSKYSTSTTLKMIINTLVWLNWWQKLFHSCSSENTSECTTCTQNYIYLILLLTSLANILKEYTVPLSCFQILKILKNLIILVLHTPHI